MDLNTKEIISHLLVMEESLMKENKELRDKLQGLVEVNARFAQEIIAIKNGNNKMLVNGFGGDTPIVTSPPEKKVKSNKVILTVDGEKTSITGNTYDHRGIFGVHGAKWDKPNLAWVVDTENNGLISEELSNKGIEFEIRNEF